MWILGLKGLTEVIEHLTWTIVTTKKVIDSTPPGRTLYIFIFFRSSVSLTKNLISYDLFPL